MTTTKALTRVSVWISEKGFTGLLLERWSRRSGAAGVLSDLDGNVHVVSLTDLCPITENSRLLWMAQIAEQCDSIKHMLATKNRAYGDSALSPMRVFSRADAVEQIKVRIDDKLSRLARGNELPDESFKDTIGDLIGYLVLLRVAMSRAAEG